MKYSEIPILMYHEISEQDNLWCVSPGDFKQQMSFLKEKGYKTITLTALKKGVEENLESEEKLVVITFDDARKGVYTDAFPILQKLGFTAAIYVVPKWIEDDKAVPQQEQYSAFLSWEELKELEEKGWEIGSHSYSHQDLTGLDRESLIRELATAEKMIEEKLGQKVNHFSYPYGKVNGMVIEGVSDKYATLVTVNKGFDKHKYGYSRQWVLRETGLEVFEKLLSRPKLSLCMIVKNEEEFLEQCLKSVQGLVDEIIIVDTGSVDRTKEIALSFGAKIFDFEWCDDFSAARNESLKHATGDWILVLDADEKMLGNEKERIKWLINNWQVEGFSLITKNYTHDKTLKGWNDGWFPSVKVRLFQNHKGIKFEGAVHELVEGTIKGEKERVKVFVEHFGFDKNIGKREEYYLKLGKKKIEEDPSLKSYHEVGLMYKDLGFLEEAEEMFEKAIELALGEEDNLKLSEEYFSLGIVYFKKGKLDKAAEKFEKAIELDGKNVEAHINLGAMYEKQKLFEKAKEILLACLKIDPKNARGYYNLGVIWEGEKNKVEARKAYEKAVELNYFRKAELLKRIERMK